MKGTREKGETYVVEIYDLIGPLKREAQKHHKKMYFAFIVIYAGHICQSELFPHKCYQ